MGCQAQVTCHLLSLQLLLLGREGDRRLDERGGQRRELVGRDAIGAVTQQGREHGPPPLELEEEPAHAAVQLLGAGAEEQPHEEEELRLVVVRHRGEQHGREALERAEQRDDDLLIIGLVITGLVIIGLLGHHGAVAAR